MPTILCICFILCALNRFSLYFWIRELGWVWLVLRIVSLRNPLADLHTGVVHVSHRNKWQAWQQAVVTAAVAEQWERNLLAIFYWVSSDFRKCTTGRSESQRKLQFNDLKLMTSSSSIFCNTHVRYNKWITRCRSLLSRRLP